MQGFERKRLPALAGGNREVWWEEALGVSYLLENTKVLYIFLPPPSKIEISLKS